VFCTKCGHQNPESSEFCNKCGGPLVNAGLGEKRYKLQSTRKRRGPSSSRLPLIFAGLLVAICAVVVVIYVLVVGPSSPPVNQIVSIKLDPVSKQMTADSAQAFTLYGFTQDNKKNAIVEGISWQVLPNDLGLLDGKGIFHPSRAGEGQIIASYQAKTGPLEAKATVTVVAGAAIEHLEIIPASINLAVTEEQAFKVKAVDKSGAEVAIQSKWSVLEASLGSIDADGLFKALKAGNATIVASYSYNNVNVSNSAVAIISDGPPTGIRRIEVSPPSIELKNGEIYQFIAKGYDKDNKEVAISAQWQLVGDVGKIDANGNFTAVTEGTGTLEATYNNLTATAEVIVSAEGISFQRYTDPALPFNFDYPSNWEVNSGDKLVKLVSPTQTDTLFNYTAIFGTENFSAAKDLATYAQENQSWAEGKFSGVTFAQEDRAFGDTNGKVIPFLASGYKGILGCAVNNSTGYFFFAYSPDKSYAQQEATFRRMVNNWTIPKTTTPSPAATPSPLLSPTATPPSGNTFTSTTYGFAFAIPEGWQQSNLPGVPAYVTGPVVSNYLPNLTVKVEELATPLTPVSFAEKIEKERLTNFYDDYKNLSLDPTTVGDQTAYKRVFTISFQGQPLQEVQYYLVRGTLGYLVTFDISSEAFLELSPVFDQIASSFTFF
jgi:hypothetical protein